MRRVVAERDEREKLIQNHVERQSFGVELENRLYASRMDVFFGVRNYSPRMSCVYKHMRKIHAQLNSSFFLLFATKTTNFVV